jgi:hypothetical protein
MRSWAFFLRSPPARPPCCTPGLHPSRPGQVSRVHPHARLLPPTPHNLIPWSAIPPPLPTPYPIRPHPPTLPSPHLARVGRVFWGPRATVAPPPPPPPLCAPHLASPPTSPLSTPPRHPQLARAVVGLVPPCLLVLLLPKPHPHRYPTHPSHPRRWRARWWGSWCWRTSPSTTTPLALLCWMRWPCSACCPGLQPRPRPASPAWPAAAGWAGGRASSAAPALARDGGARPPRRRRGFRRRSRASLWLRQRRPPVRAGPPHGAHAPPPPRTP